MLSNKHIMMSAFCITALVHGAAENAIGLQHASSSSAGGALTFADCFNREALTVPGPKQSYAEVIVEKSSKIHDWLNNQLLIVEARVGFCVGTDQQFIAEVGQELTNIVKTEWSPQNADTFNAKLPRTDKLLLSATLQKITGTGAEHTKKAKNCELRLFWLRNNGGRSYWHFVVAVQTTHSTTVYTTMDVGIRKLLTASLAIEYDDAKALENQALILPPNLMHLLHDAAPSSASTMAERLVTLRQYAQLLCATAEETHEVPILILDDVRYAAFVQQKLNTETN